MFFFFGLDTEMISVAENHQGISMKPLEPPSLKLGEFGQKNDLRDEGFAECSHDQRSSDPKRSVLFG